MANKLARLIAELDYNDLLLLKKDLNAGNIEKLITFHIKEKQNNRITSCPVCGGAVKEGEGFHLQFGPPELRKKVTFDGVDCMHYFFENMKKKKNITENDDLVMIKK
jgi:NAD-dependent SIR2 family protein deacetylase